MNKNVPTDAVVENQREIPEELDRQTKSLNHLNEVYEDLRVRLSPVLSPPQDSEAEKVLSPPQVNSMTTEYGILISKNTDSVFQLSEKIHYLLRCLEV